MIKKLVCVMLTMLEILVGVCYHFYMNSPDDISFNKLFCRLVFKRYSICSIFIVTVDFLIYV
jgi:hypothetical protein